MRKILLEARTFRQCSVRFLPFTFRPFSPYRTSPTQFLSYVGPGHAEVRKDILKAFRRFLSPHTGRYSHLNEKLVTRIDSLLLNPSGRLLTIRPRESIPLSGHILLRWEAISIRRRIEIQDLVCQNTLQVNLFPLSQETRPTFTPSTSRYFFLTLPIMFDKVLWWEWKSNVFSWDWRLTQKGSTQDALEPFLKPCIFLFSFQFIA